MSFNITVEGGTSVRLPTAGKYCDRDIIVTAEGGGIELDVVTASALPGSVVNGRIVVITGTGFANVYVSTDEPASPGSGDILIMLEPGADVQWGVMSEPYFISGGLSYAAQWDGTKWVVLEGYYGVNGEWEQFSTTLPPVGTPLADMSWADISKVAKAGKGADYFKVGDMKGVAVSGTVGSDTISGTRYCKIIGINHNKAIEGNGIHFQFLWDGSGNGLAWDYGHGTTNQGYMMNTSASNAGGWQSSYMRNTLCATFFTRLPAELQAVIRECVKYTDNTGGSGGGDASKVTATRDKIWLLTYTEITGNAPASGNKAEAEFQTQYEYYAAGNSKLRYRVRATSNLCNWWLRSPQVTTTTNFMAVATTGSTSTYNANISHGFAPCFKV